MAEDLGQIRIVFPNAFGGGSTSGAPLPKSGGAGDVGGASTGSFVQMVANTAANLGNAFTTLTSVVSGFVGKLSDYANTVQSIIQRSISGIMEGGKYSGAVQMQAALIKVQGTLDTIAQGNLLGPLYTLVLRWYRELMALLAPVRMAISAIFTAIGGVLVVAVKALTPLILNLSKAVLIGVAKITEYLSQQSKGTVSTASGLTLAGGALATILGIAGLFGAGPLGGYGGFALGTTIAAGLGLGAAGAAGVAISSEWEAVKADLAKISPELHKILEAIEKGNRAKLSQNPNDWVNKQLFDLTKDAKSVKNRTTPWGVSTLGP